MKFEDIDINNLDLTKPDDFVDLFIQYLCGKRVDSGKLIEENIDNINEIINHIKGNGLNYEQFNEILLNLNQNRISEGFFEFFFEIEKYETLDLRKLKYGITKFRGFCLLHYGNIEYSYKILSEMTKEKIELELKDYIKKKESILGELKRRSKSILNLDKIDKDKTWYLGYISQELLKEEIKLFTKLSETNSIDGDDLIKLREIFVKSTQDWQSVIEKGEKNTEKYLTWDYIDVYLATSMRNKCDFEEIFEFLELLENDSEISKLNLRFFDPTQSFTKLNRDKGLIEGLMLKRAKCTVYMIQESDTLGKDSELASTLAQKKPVITYIPDYEVDLIKEKIKTYSLEYIKKLIFSYLSDNIFEIEPFKDKMNWTDPQKQWVELRDKLIEFIRFIDKYRYDQPFQLYNDADEKFKLQIENYSEICNILAIATKIYWNRRANSLQKYHPLAMQIDLDSGVANGVIVVRDPKICIKILIEIITNSLEFEIRHFEEGYTGLIEKKTKSTYRIITDNLILTNSFWNFFKL